MSAIFHLSSKYSIMERKKKGIFKRHVRSFSITRHMFCNKVGFIRLKCSLPNSAKKKRNLSKTKTKTKMDMNGLRDWIISLSIIHAKRNKSKQEEKEREQIERKKNNMKWITFRPKSFKNKEGMFIELQLSQRKFFHKVSLLLL